MQAPIKDKNDIKIFILYLMRNIGYPLDFANINDIVVQDGLVGYFDFAQCFAELLDTGNIREIKPEKEKDDELYEVTEQGIRVAENLESNLLGYIKEKSLKSALRLLSFKKRGSEIKCSAVPTEDGKYIMTCTIIEERREIMKVTVLLESRAQFEKMRYNFNDRPETVYRGILALLSGEVNYLLD